MSATRHRATALALATMLSTLSFAAPADAKISKELAAEVQGYVDKHKGSKEGEVRIATVLAWGHVIDRKRRKELEALLTDGDQNVRVAAAIGLMIAGERKAIDKVVGQLAAADDRFPGTLRYVVSLVDDKRELKILENLLKTKGLKPERRAQVYDYLALQPASSPLFAKLSKDITSKDGAKRKLAIGGLKGRVDARAVKVLGAMLSTSYPDAHMAAVEMAVELTGYFKLRADAVRVLERALKLPATSKAREPAARRLAALNNTPGRKVLLSIALATKDAEARKALLREMVEVRVPVQLAKLAKAIKATKDQEEKELLYQLAAIDRDKKTIETLTAMWASLVFEERLIAAKALPLAGSDDSVPIFSQGLREGQTVMRKLSAEALGILASPKSINALRDALKVERDRGVRLALIDALGRIKDPRSLNVLRFQTMGNDRELKLHLIEAVREIGLAKGQKVLEILLRDSDRVVQWRAFLATMEIAPKSGARLIKRALANPPQGFFEDVLKLSARNRDYLLNVMLKSPSSRLRGEAKTHLLTHLPDYMGWLRSIVFNAKYDAELRLEFADRLAERAAAQDRVLFEKLARVSESAPIRQLAAWTLTRYGNKDLSTNFRGLMTETSPGLQMIGAFGLVALSR